MPTFTKLLIANRGEIAARVIRTARALGYATVAIHSDADADSLAVALADEAVRIGPASAAESYLDPERILAAAARTGADAIHPGYGFLSENADFARRCAEAGVVFVGPPPAAVEAMGDKARAKAKMKAAEVPTVPGFEGEQSVERLAEEAGKIGYPVLLKAVAGGGGRGMRRVDEADELAAAVEGARAEAQNAFGNGELMVEKLVEGARHVEIQVFADEHGAAIHLGERDCSAQRRHQKIIEESPSPAVAEQLRARMGAAAVAAARAIGYVGAGTVEFLLAADGSFYFLEMNTRLQVEHPVTELVTGLDLVAWQLELAAGGRLPLSQEQVGLSGHAIEARLYAEDPAAGFVPQTGEILAWCPAELPGLRIDHGLRVGAGLGQKIGSDYDPMVAKLIAHGATREQARRRLIMGLRRTALLGPRTNKRFLIDLLEHGVFVSGEVTTSFVESDAASVQLTRAGAKLDATAAALAAVLWAERGHGRGHARAGFPVGWRTAHGSSSTVELRCGELLASVQLSPAGGELGPPSWRAVAKIGDASGEELELSVLERDEARARLRVSIDGHQRDVLTAWSGAGQPTLIVELDGHEHRISEHRPHEADADASADGSDGVVRAPTMGRVLAIAVEPGQHVEPGQRLLTLEAMKIESTITAALAGTISELRVAVDDQVDNRQVLLTIEPNESSPSPDSSQ